MPHTSWKKQYLYKGGRSIPTKSTQIQPTIYHKSLFIIRKVVRNWQEKIQQDFLWVHNLLAKKLHLVKWDTVWKEKNNGEE